jgi:hypothetical protein
MNAEPGGRQTKQCALLREIYNYNSSKLYMDEKNWWDRVMSDTMTHQLEVDESKTNLNQRSIVDRTMAYF